MQVRSIAALCQDMPRLVALVHVSTAYCHCQEEHIQVAEEDPLYQLVLQKVPSEGS